MEKTEYTNSIGMKFKKIEPGKFMMGKKDDEPQAEASEVRHEVEITKPFYMGIYEVTQDEYQQVMQSNPSFHQTGGDGGRLVDGMETGEFPVDNVSWDKARKFCERLNAKEKGANFTYRLPTEAEWEYACRAGSTTYFHFGDVLRGVEANCRGTIVYPPSEEAKEGQAKGVNIGRTTPVGSYPANDWGLYDMSGNVYEWVEDWYDDKYQLKKDADGEYELAVDPQGPSLSEDASKADIENFEKKYNKRVVRGGSFGFPPGACRSANRKIDFPDQVRTAYGFRVVLEPK